MKKVKATIYPDHSVRKGFLLPGKQERMKLTDFSGCMWTKGKRSEDNDFCRHFFQQYLQTSEERGPVQEVK